VFDCDISYNAIVHALQHKELKQFVGTIDTYPQAGKYHFSGHRKCGVCATPVEVLQHAFVCKTCKKPYTFGVMDRVMQLADRRDISMCYNWQSIEYIISLPELLAQAYNVSETSKKVKAIYMQMIQHLGAEFEILTRCEISDIAQCSNSFVAEGIRRMRAGEVYVTEGYDGEYGDIRVFTNDEVSEFVKNTEYIPSKNIHKPLQRFYFDLHAYDKEAQKTDFSLLHGKKPNGQLQLFL